MDPIPSVQAQIRDRVGDLEDHVIQYKQQLWAAEAKDLPEAPAWMTLSPTEDLICWAQTLTENLGRDGRSTDVFVELTHAAPLGYAEARKLLHHIFKHKPQGPRDAPRAKAGAWLKKRLSEKAIQATQNKDRWEPQGPGKGNTRLMVLLLNTKSLAKLGSWHKHMGCLGEPGFLLPRSQAKRGPWTRS